MIGRVLAAALFGALATASSFAQSAGQVLSSAGALTDVAKGRQTSKLKFAGIHSFKEEEIRAAIAQHVREIDEQGVTPARGDDVAHYVGAFYRKAGFSKVETSFKIAGDSVTVIVNEGPRTLLRGLHFTGNKTFTEEQLYEYMIGAKPERFQKEPEMFPYNEGEMSAGAERVHAYYVSEGYLDVKVDATGHTKISADSSRADVTVNVEEGIQYTFGALSFTGDPIFPVPKLLVASVSGLTVRSPGQK